MFALKLNVESCKHCPFNRHRPYCGTKGNDGIKFCHAIWSWLRKKDDDYVPCSEEGAQFLGVWDPDNGWMLMSSSFKAFLVPTGEIAPGERDP
jgi:hypothetical protein